MLFINIFVISFSLLFSSHANAQVIKDNPLNDATFSTMQAYAILQTLNANLLSSNSATKTLQAWCEDHQMATTPQIRAVRNLSAHKDLNQDIRALLNVSDTEPVMYRRVQLYCGEVILSEADNWYVPSRLTTDMNRLLTQTETPFGVAVRPLNFYRKTHSEQLLWQPLPKNWDRKIGAVANNEKVVFIPDFVLEHKAILLTEKNIPFSFVVESYTKNIFSFSQLNEN